MTWNNVNTTLPENNILVDVYVEHRLSDNDEYITWYERIIDAWYITEKKMWFIDHPKYRYPMSLETDNMKVTHWMVQPPMP